MIDISQLQHAEERLRESDERFRLAAKAARDAVWDWDLRQDKVWRSEGFHTLFGYTAETIAPDASWWIERIHPDDRDRVRSVLPSGDASTPAQYTIEYRFRRADGSYADVLDRGFVMYDGEGHPVRMVGSLMDMSERRRAEELSQLQQAEMAQHRADQHDGRGGHGLGARAQSTAGGDRQLCRKLRAGHPRHAARIRGRREARGVSALPPTTAKLLEWVEKIAANTHRAGEIIRRLRTFTRKSDSRRSTVAVDELVTDVVELMEAEIRRRRMRVAWAAAIRGTGRRRFRTDPAGALQPAAQRLRGYGRQRRRSAPCDYLGPGRCAGGDYLRSRRRGGDRSGKPRSRVRSVLHVQAEWHGHRAGHQPVHRRRSWRPVVVQCQSRSRRYVSFCLADLRSAS